MQSQLLGGGWDRWVWTLLEGCWLDESEEVGAPGNMSSHLAALKPMLTF